jgi:hypothetical protein
MSRSEGENELAAALTNRVPRPMDSANEVSGLPRGEAKGSPYLLCTSVVTTVLRGDREGLAKGEHMFEVDRDVQKRLDLPGRTRMTKATVGIRVFLTAGLLVLGTAMPAVAGQPTVRYTTQTVKLAPFEQSRTFTLKGRSTSAGCAFSYPDVTVPAGSDRWQVRDIGIDLSTCTKLVEEGVPTVSSADSDPALTTVSSSVGNQTKPASPAAITSVGAGHAHAWYEDVAGLTVSSDTTFISFGYNGSCATSGSASVEWVFAVGTGWHIVTGTNGGTSNLTCARFFADTWASIRTSSFPACPFTTITTTFSHVRVQGSATGAVTGSRVDSEVRSNLLCPFPLFEHFEVKKTG